MENTTEKNNLIARTLMGKLLDIDEQSESVPSLLEVGGPNKFCFINDKSSFVLGSLQRVDFVFAANGIGKEHVSFVRDINGVSIIPISPHKTYINDLLLAEPQLLAHGSIIKIGTNKLFFSEHNEEPPAKIEPELPKPAKQITKQPKAKNLEKTYLLKAFDWLFVLAFVLASIGSLFIVAKF